MAITTTTTMDITTTARATLLVTIQHQSHMPSQHMEDMRVNEEKANRLRTIRDAKKVIGDKNPSVIRLFSEMKKNKKKADKEGKKNKKRQDKESKKSQKRKDKGGKKAEKEGKKNKKKAAKKAKKNAKQIARSMGMRPGTFNREAFLAAQTQ